VGADFDDLAAGAAAAGAAGVAGVGGVAAAAAGALVDDFCTPPWPLQAPLPCAVDVVPSLQVVVPPAAGVAGVAGVAGAVAAGAAAAGAAVPAFCTPPWPLQVPLPVEVEVVPSLQVVSAVAGRASTNTINGAAMSPMRSVFFINGHSLVVFDFAGEL
jgi:hypothetical protein